MKLIILDRDGVINLDSKNYIKSAKEWQPIAGSIEAIAKLSQADYKVVIATNQSGLARGLFSSKDLHEMHAKLRSLVAAVGGKIDAIFVCPHGPDDGCNCRKPLPGLFQDISKRYDMPLHGVPAVGDSLRDLLAAASLGCQTWLVLTGNGNATSQDANLPKNTKICADLAQVVDNLLKE